MRFTFKPTSLLIAAALLGTTGAALAQGAYPNRPIRLIVPFPPGGTTDISSRIIADRLVKNLGWTIVIDNKPGAGGNIGADAVAKAAPDGYTIGMAQTSNLAINPTLYSKIPYNPLKDFVPVVLATSTPLVIAVSAKSPYQTLAQFIAAAKAKPNGVTYATPGSGTVGHLAAELLNRTAGVQMTHVPYKGASQAVTDLIGGQVDSYYATAPAVIEQIRGGKMRALVVTSSKRSPALPAVPTVAESGYAGFEATSWYGIVAPAGTPAPVVEKLNAEIRKALQSPEVSEGMVREGGGVLGSSSAEFGAYLKAEYDKWSKVVKASGAKVD
jgi:tripartite-type tricarboxylate transporter receptor subunit TctC